MFLNPIQYINTWTFSSVKVKSKFRGKRAMPTKVTERPWHLHQLYLSDVLFVTHSFGSHYDIWTETTFYSSVY